MQGSPKEMEERERSLVSDLQRIHGDDLVGVIRLEIPTRYAEASGQRGRGRPREQVLVVLSEEGINHLDRCLTLLPAWQKKGVETPLFLTREYIETSLDSYPIEFLNMKAGYRVIAGEDVLAELAIPPEHIRLECERELKGKLLHLRQGFLETRGRERELQALVALSIDSLCPILLALLHLKQVPLPEGPGPIVEAAATAMDLDVGLFSRLMAVYRGERIRNPELTSLVLAYLGEMRKAVMYVDAWKQ